MGGWVGLKWGLLTLCFSGMYTFERYRKSKIISQNNNAQLIILILTFFNCFDDFTMLAHASRTLILDSISNYFSESKTREVMQRYSRVQVTSTVLRLLRSRIKLFQYLRLTHIDIRITAFKSRCL